MIFTNEVLRLNCCLSKRKCREMSKGFTPTIKFYSNWQSGLQPTWETSHQAWLLGTPLWHYQPCSQNTTYRMNKHHG